MRFAHVAVRAPFRQPREGGARARRRGRVRNYDYVSRAHRSRYRVMLQAIVQGLRSRPARRTARPPPSHMTIEVFGVRWSKSPTGQEVDALTEVEDPPLPWTPPKARSCARSVRCREGSEGS